MRQTLICLAFLLLTLSPSNAQNRAINFNDSGSYPLNEMPRPGIPEGVPDSSLRVRPIRINPQLQQPESLNIGDTILLDLFTDRRFRAIIQSLDLDIHNTLTVVAKIEGQDFGYFFLTTHDNISLATIELPSLKEWFCTWHQPRDGRYFLRQVDPSMQQPLEGGQAEIPEEGGISPDDPDQPAQNPVWQTPPVTHDETSPDIVTVMILYTPAADNWSRSSDAGIENTIAQLMARARLAASNSNILLDFQLAHSELVQYTELNTNDDLYRLQAVGDGYLDIAHTLRNSKCADLVVLLEQISFTGGLGYQLNTAAGSPSYGFSLTRVQQASWTYTTVHEMGHNMGAHHHKQQSTQPGPGVFSYSAGWRWTGNDNGKYCSVMTYESGNYFADGVSHTRVGFFSNPDLTYQGVRTGDPTDADNARTIRQTKALVAAYRSGCCTPPTVQASQFTVLEAGNSTLKIGWTRGNGTEGVLVLARARFAVNADPVSGVTYTANAEWGVGRQVKPGNFAVYAGKGSEVTLTGLTPETDYFFEIFEYNSTGFCYLNPGLSGTASTACTSAATPVISGITQPTCALPTGSLFITGLPATGTWRLKRLPGGHITAGQGSSFNLTGIPTGTHTFSVTTEKGCVSPETGPVTIIAPADSPQPPMTSATQQPDCQISTGTIQIEGLPVTGTWNLQITPGNQSREGSGTRFVWSGLPPGTYTFTVANASGCRSAASQPATIQTPPPVPGKPTLQEVISPTCIIRTGSVTLANLPGNGNWILMMEPGTVKISGAGPSHTLNGLDPGIYAFSVINEAGCSSESLQNIVIPEPPAIPGTPVAESLIQPDCSRNTGSASVTGLPSEGPWTLLVTPGNLRYTGTGSSTVLAGLNPGDYSLTVENEAGCPCEKPLTFTITEAPPVPDPPTIREILQPTCLISSGSIRLTGMPDNGAWELITREGNLRMEGTGNQTLLENLAPGTYHFLLRNSFGCLSTESVPAIVDEVPELPAPVITRNERKLVSSAAEGNQWYNQYGAIEGATEATYEPLYNGDFYVIASLGQCISKASDPVSVEDAGVWVRVYPNPARADLIIELLGNRETATYELFNLMGRKLTSGVFTDKTILTVTNYAQGTYLLQLKFGGKLEIRRVLVGN